MGAHVIRCKYDLAVPEDLVDRSQSTKPKPLTRPTKATTMPKQVVVAQVIDGDYLHEANCRFNFGGHLPNTVLSLSRSRFGDRKSVV